MQDSERERIHFSTATSDVVDVETYMREREKKSEREQQYAADERTKKWREERECLTKGSSE